LEIDADPFYFSAQEKIFLRAENFVPLPIKWRIKGQKTGFPPLYPLKTDSKT